MVCNDSEEALMNHQIDQLLRYDKQQNAQYIRIVVCGTGDSGKTTLIRQLRIIHMNFTDTERRDHIPNIIHNIIYYCYATMIHMCENGVFDDEIDFMRMYSSDDSDDKNCVAGINTLFKTAMSCIHYKFPRPLLDMTTQMVKSPILRSYIRANANVLLVPDGLESLLNNFNTIIQPEYTPSDNDILRCKYVTTGIQPPAKFFANGTPFLIYDVGGQRLERKTWSPLYDGVSCVIYVVALTDYNQMLAEDKQKNRLIESIEVFQYVRKDPRLAGKPIILFLNKCDLFISSIKTTPLTVCFPDCPANVAGDCHLATNYIKDKLWDGKKRDIDVTHVTHATDKENVKVVFDAVRTFCIQRDLIANGLAKPV